MSKIRSRDTGPELRVRKRLHALGFRFRLYRRDLPGTPDIVLPRYRTVIMVHGCLWHGHRFCAYRGKPKSNAEYWRKKIRANRARDRRKERELRRLGWRVITIWECETGDEGAITAKVVRLLVGRAAEKAAAIIKSLSSISIKSGWSLQKARTQRIISWIRKNKKWVFKRIRSLAS